MSTSSWAHGRNLDIVTQAQTIESFAELREDLDRLSSAIYLAELSDRFTIEHAEARPVYELLHASLVRLARGDGWHLVTRSFELALLEVTGFRPEWGRLPPLAAPLSSPTPLAGRRPAEA